MRNLRIIPWLAVAGCSISLLALIAEVLRSGSLTPLSGLSLSGIAVALFCAIRLALRNPNTPGLDQPQAEQTSLELNELRRELEAQLDEQARQLETRERQLSERLLVFHEWLEYPTRDGTPGADRSAPELAPAELTERDRQLQTLINDQARQVYRRIRDGYYQPGEQLDAKLIREDVVSFVTQVARLYRPEADNPLLETSVEQLLRAGSRICLHVLVVLERLPLDVKNQSFAELYAWFQTAVKAFDLYSKAEPYLGYAGQALYAGRLLAGASPLTLGITWALTELTKRGAKSLGKRFVDQQSVALLNDLTQVIGFEVAAVFSSDFRFRDPAWIYGSELTVLMSRFPVSRESLAQALREVGSLTLRNEYDRIWLYRCLSMHRAAEPLVDAHQLLNAAQRQTIARRLEQFYQGFIHGRTGERVESWLRDVESRLGLRLSGISLPDHSTAVVPVSADQDPLKAARSLAAFLTAVKSQPARLLRDWQPRLQSLQSLSAEFWQMLLDDVPDRFEPPDLDPKHELVELFLSDLCRLAVRVPPHDVPADEFVLESAAYFGADVERLHQKLDREYVAAVNERFVEDAPGAKITPAIARALISHLFDDEHVLAVYAGVTVRAKDPVDAAPRAESLLAVTDQRLLLMNQEQPGSVLSSPCGRVSLESKAGLVSGECLVSGPAWTSLTSDLPLALQMTVPWTAASMTRSEVWFRPLLNVVRPRVGPGGPGDTLANR